MVLTAAVFAGALADGFAFDDEAIIVNNPLVRGLGRIPHLFAAGYWAGAFGAGVPFDLYRPLVLATFALDYAVGGLDPLGYHLVNVTVHAAAALGLLLLARHLGLGPGPAFAAATLFAVHPITTEAVTGVVGRSELLMTLGLFLAWLLHLRGGSPRRARGRWTAASCAVFAAALLAKEQAAVLPVLLVLSDLVAWRAIPSPSPRSFLFRPWWRYGGHLLVLAAYLALRAAVLRHPFALQQIPVVDNPLAPLPWGARLPTVAAVAGRYLGLLGWPATLSADYSYDAIPVIPSWGSLAAIAGLVGWAGIIAVALRAGVRGRRALALGPALSVLTFLPASNLVVPIGTIMGERLFYAPAAGLCLALGGALAAIGDRLGDGPARRHLARAGPVALGLVLGALSLRTVARNRDWESNDTLFASAVRAVPGSAKAWFIHGVLLSGHGRQAEALVALRRALDVRPDFSDAWLALGGLHEQQRQWRDAEAAFGRALALREGALGPGHPGVAEALYYLAHVHFSEGELAGGPDAPRHFAEAEALFRRALAIRERALGPDHPLVAQVLDGLGGLLATQRQDARAEALFRQALGIRERALGPEHPDVALSLNNLALLLYHEARYAEAEPLFRRSIAILEQVLGPEHPALVQRLDNYAALLRRTNRPVEAMSLEARAAAIRTRGVASASR